MNQNSVGSFVARLADESDPVDGPTLHRKASQGFASPEIGMKAALKQPQLNKFFNLGMQG